MPNILINRLYLNLKSFESPNSTTATEAFSRPMFASRRILGNIGAPLHTILDDDFDSETENFEGEREAEEALRDVGEGDEESRETAERCGNTTLVPVVSGIVSIHLTYYLTYIVHLRTPIACSYR